MIGEFDQLVKQVADEIQKRNWMLATVESCTGGWIAQTVTSVAGSSNWFERGFVTYSNLAKEQLVGVSKDSLIAHGAVSRQVAREMAQGGVVHSQANIAVSVTGIAGPDGGTDDKPVGMVWIGWADKNSNTAEKRYLFEGDRQEVRRATVQKALEGVQRFMTECEQKTANQ